MGLLTICIGATLGCGVTMSELQAINSQAKTLQVPCHPWQITENVKLFALRSLSTNALAKAWKTHAPDPKKRVTAEQLRKIYNDAYKLDYPHWLEIIEKQLL